jgi:predicted permease
MSLRRDLSKFAALFRRAKPGDDLEEEIHSHLAMEEQENLESGMPPEEAHYAALRRFGNVTLAQERSREMWRWNSIETLWQDVRYGLRQLRRSPGVTAVAVLSLALGIGANTAIFSLIDAVLLKTLAVQNPQQLTLLDWASKEEFPEGFVNSLTGNMYQDKSGRVTCTSFSYSSFEQIRDRNNVFSNVSALAAMKSGLNVAYKGQPGRANGQLVSGTFFSTLDVQPVLGRALTPDDDRIGASLAAVISYGYWERRFGRDPAVVARAITVNGVPFTIVGVSPPEFFGVQPGLAVEVWLPLHSQPLVEPSWSPEGPAQGTQAEPQPLGSLFAARDDWWLLIMARLKPGVSEMQAKSAAGVIFQQSLAADVKPTTKPESIPRLGLESASRGLDYLRGEFSKPLFILMTVVGLVLLIACANVANLLLARAESRQKEIAVRLAVGAGRSRLIRQLLTESVLLAGLGGTVGFLLAFWGTDLLVAFMASGREPITLRVTPDPSVLGFTVAVSVLTGILCGLSPALRGTRMDLTPALKESARTLQGATDSKHGLRLGLGKTLVVTQVALSVLLLVGAVLFVRTLTNLENVNAGFNQRNVLLFGIDPSQDGYKGQRLADFYQELGRRLGMLPGVRSVSMSMHRLIGGGVSVNGLQISGYTPKPGQKGDHLETHVNHVGPKFFETMGIPLVLGRSVGEGDTAAAPKVAVVNEKFVHQFLGGENPIGRRFGFGDKTTATDYEIVGVVGDTKYSDLRREVPVTVYLPYGQDLEYLGPMNFEVRTAGNPMDLVSAVRRTAQDMDRNLALYQVETQVDQINRALFQERLFARLTSFFGALAASLACVGIYGIMAFAVMRRAREIGIRMALGASRGQITEMVLRETCVLAGTGIAFGIFLALAASRLIATLLYGLRPTDPLTITIAALLMVAAAVFAAYGPSRRASHLDPMVALRYE